MWIGRGSFGSFVISWWFEQLSNNNCNSRKANAVLNNFLFTPSNYNFQNNHYHGTCNQAFTEQSELMESSDMIRLTKGAVSGGGTLSASAMISNSSVPLQDFRKIHSQGRNWKVVKFYNVSNFCYLQRKDRVRSFNFLTPSAFPRQRAVLLAAQVVWLLRHFHIFMISFTFNLRLPLSILCLYAASSPE